MSLSTLPVHASAALAALSIGGKATREQRSLSEQSLPSASGDGETEEGQHQHFDDLATALALLQALLGALDKYQEQSTLLDPHLEALIHPVIHYITDAILHDPKACDELVTSDPPSALVYLFKYLYTLCKTRGYKAILKFWSHEAIDLEPTLALLQACGSHHHLWEVRYTLLLWLSLLVIIPFDLKVLDEQAESSTATLMRRISDTATRFLDATGKERDAAAIVLARLLTRKDTHAGLDAFLAYTDETLRKDSGLTVFQATGIVSTLAAIFKTGNRDLLLPRAAKILPLCERAFTTKPSCTNTVVRKNAIKAVQRIGLTFLKPQVTTWRYQRGHRSLATNLQATNQTTSLHVDAASALPQPSSVKQTKVMDTETETGEEEEPPEEIEEVLHLLLEGLRDKDTIVRWSAAKGLGRITARLSADFAGEVIESIIDLFAENVILISETEEVTRAMAIKEANLSTTSDATWQGVCLALAEVARRGLLLPERIESLLPWLLRALTYDVQRGAHSVGAHVRDAACYVCWSFARAYAPSVMAPFVHTLASQLILITLFDREINVRRAASAAIQENVGRQGIFPRGIDLITAADYFTIGNRQNAFTNVAFTVANFEEYRNSLIEHLIRHVLRHWDVQVRTTAAQALSMLASEYKDACLAHLPELASLVNASNVAIRHGALLGVAAIVGQVPSPSDQVASVASLAGDFLPPSGPQSMYVKSFGSELTMLGLSTLAHALGQANHVTNSSVHQWIALMNITLTMNAPTVHKVSLRALRVLFASPAYSVSEDESMDHYVRAMADTSLGHDGRAAHALALAQVPLISYINTKRWPSVIAALLKGTSQDMVGAEARVASVHALQFLLFASMESNLFDQTFSTHRDALLSALFPATEDYSTDARGDVGSWVRSAAMKCLTSLALFSTSLFSLTTIEVERIVAVLLKQCCERIDRIRATGFHCLTLLFLADQNEMSYLFEEVPPVKMDSFSREPLRSVTGFEALSNACALYREETYLPAEALLSFIHFKAYREPVLEGIILSIGGLSESSVKEASRSLRTFLPSLPTLSSSNTNETSMYDVLHSLYAIWKRVEGEDRVAVAFLVSLETMLLDSHITTLLVQEGGLACAEVLRDLAEAVSMKLTTKDARKLLIQGKVYRLLHRSIQARLALKRACSIVAFLSLPCTPLDGQEEANRARLQIQTSCLMSTFSHLEHAFPRVRKVMAENLYLWVSMGGCETWLEQRRLPTEVSIEEILITTNWSLLTLQTNLKKGNAHADRCRDKEILTSQAAIGSIAQQLRLPYMPRKVNLIKKQAV